MKRLWMDLGDLGAFAAHPDPMLVWHDHGQGLLCTILRAAGIDIDVRSTRSYTDVGSVATSMFGYDMLFLNIRSYTFLIGRKVARLFKTINPHGTVCVGGMHATVAPEDLVEDPAFDHICQGSGENVIVDLAKDHSKFPRVFEGKAAESLGDWPMIDRREWPYPREGTEAAKYWPLETAIWAPPPMASVITNRVCPWSCSFCNEASYIPHMGRKPVDQIIDELNYLDEHYGPLGSVAMHDSMWFQQPSYLEEWLQKYPKRARRMWPYWAAGRADTVRKWPDLFEALVRETNWHSISIGFESGSTRTLKMLNKECTAEDNHFTIDLLNQIGDDLVANGKKPPYFWANIMWGIPGETREDILETMRMIRFMRYRWVVPALYTPYPGSILGHQLIAEGKSLLNKNDHRRYPGQAKATGIDYQFIQEVQEGKHDAEVLSKPWAPCLGYAPEPAKKKPTHIYVFRTTDGHKKFAYGTSKEEALKIQGQRLTPEELSEVLLDDVEVTGQRQARIHLPMLG